MTKPSVTEYYRNASASAAIKGVITPQWLDLMKRAGHYENTAEMIAAIAFVDPSIETGVLNKFKTNVDQLVADGLMKV